MPPTCTVQAPQAAMPQPNFGPRMPAMSRSAHKSGISGSASMSMGLPLTVRRMGIPFVVVHSP